MVNEILSVFITLPLWYQYGAVALLGAIVASFANVVAYRMHTNVTLTGRSRCFSCGHTLAWYELIPIVSYLALHGRCRSCRARIPVRDVLVEVVTAALFVSAYALATTLLQALVWWIIIGLLLVVTIYDIEHFIIPNELVIIIAVVTMTVFTITSWPLTTATIVDLLLRVVTAAGFYATLWKLSQGRWLGFGDVKLAAALAPLLTVEQAFSMVVLSFWIGAVVGVIIVYVPYWFRRVRRRTLVMSGIPFTSEIPFAPFIAAAFLVVYMYGINVFSFFAF